VEDNEFAELNDLAAKHNVSLAWIGRQALLEFMARYRHQQHQLPLRFTAGNAPLVDRPDR
jgi:hypothetical protein